MAKRIIEGIEVESGSGNVFADLCLPDPDKLKVTTQVPGTPHASARAWTNFPTLAD